MRIENIVDWCLFGDSAYRNHSRVRLYGMDANFNGNMKSVHISIEWNYSTTASLFSFKVYLLEQHKFISWLRC